jgi:hypothetical protein
MRQPLYLGSALNNNGGFTQYKQPSASFFPTPTATSSHFYWGPTRANTPISPSSPFDLISPSSSPSSFTSASAYSPAASPFSLSAEAPVFSPMYLSPVTSDSRLSVQAFSVNNNNNQAVKTDKKKKKKKKSSSNPDKVVPPPPFAVREDLSTDSYMDSHIVSNSSDPDNKYDFVLLRGVKNARSGMKAAPPCTIACKYGRNCFRKDCRFSHDPSLFVNGIYIGPPVPASSNSNSSSPSLSAMSEASSKSKVTDEFDLQHFAEHENSMMSPQSWAA